MIIEILRTIWLFSASESVSKQSTQLKLKLNSSLQLKLDTLASIKHFFVKVENILKGSLDSIPSPSPSMKIQIMSWKVCLRCNGKTLLGILNKLLKTKKLFTPPSNM